MNKLELALPEIWEYIELVEGPDTAQSHKEQSPNFILKFVKDLKAVTSGFKNNPFTEDDFKPINSSHVNFPGAIANDVTRMFEIGEQQYKHFVKTRFEQGTLMVSDTAISKNSFKLPGSASVIKPDSDQIKLNQSTVMKLDSACLNFLAGALNSLRLSLLVSQNVL